MIFVIDLIKSDNVAETAHHWEQVCRFFSRQAGFVSGRLLETIESLHPTEDFKLTSVTCWETDHAWQVARQTARSATELAHSLPKLAGKFTAFKGTFDQGSTYNPGKNCGVDNGDRMVLVDVIRLMEDRMKSYSEMWLDANAYMSSKPGYIGACLHVTNDTKNEIKYINLAEWASKEVFFSSLDTPEFLKIIGDFKNDFSLYLSKGVKAIEPEETPKGAEAL